MNGYIITPVQDGGYVVTQRGVPGNIDMFLLACTSLNEALTYVKAKLEGQRCTQI